MTAREDGIGREFWRISLEDLAEAMETRQSEYGNPDEPLKFKTYRGLPRRPLTTRVPTEPHPVDTLDDPALSTLLHYGYGISRQEFDTNGTWPYHRTVASARCLFGVQLYVCLADGAHHYDAPHHALVRLRQGDHRELLTRATGTGGPAPQAVLVLSGMLSKPAYIYRDYAYRLCTQEAGLLAGNLDLVARAMGLRAHVHHQFLDEPVHKLLGLDGDEEPALLVLPLHRADAGTPPSDRLVAETAGALAATIEAIEPQVVPSGLRVTRACPVLTEVNRASLRTDTAGFSTALPVAPAVSDTEPLPLPTTEVPDPGLARVLRARNSGPGIFRPIASQVDGVELWARLARIRTGVVSDVVPAGAPAPLEIFLTVGDLTGIPAGAYRLAPETGALHPVARATSDAPDAADTGPNAVTAIERVTIPGPVFTHMNAVVHLVGDRDWAFDTFGDRGYRVINQEAGLLAHRVCVAAAAQGMSGRIVNAYHAEGVRAALGLTERRHTPVFQILLARTGPGGRMIVPVEPEAVE
ncbi:SagB family peptide dehydrogenase [Kitasatospora sp. DSM 101779]|uniref:SagB family peptide dehydrogenase n=1 Tax=Kitasatospora sp. DSM 101779 TaxID=2853165 RepID=UPI0021D94F5D|nr:SagB family peptide dehydrogenase [Kitasatospora sp. DSM 101779]MCU7826899.1 SagB family peptide dehydrogenase [Kitasatospora sp. DSM 101779]